MDSSPASGYRPARGGRDGADPRGVGPHRVGRIPGELNSFQLVDVSPVDRGPEGDGMPTTAGRTGTRRGTLVGLAVLGVSAGVPRVLRVPAAPRAVAPAR